MRIAMIGTGYVGLVSGVCFSNFGHSVVCVDTDAQKIARLQAGEVPIYEPGLAAVLAQNSDTGRLSFTTDMAAALKGADAAFIAVGTPSRRGDGHADLSYVMAAARDVARNAEGGTVVVMKSTVPIGTNRRVAEEIRRVAPDLDFDIASNPEFLREGAAIADFMRPDRIVFGCETNRAAEVIRDIYRPLFQMEFPCVQTDLESAEMIKYAANAFLATKITFINEIAALCERVGADVDEVARGIGLDGRIGAGFLNAGPGYGGSCFPKDTRALARTAQEHGLPLQIVETVINSNEDAKRRAVDKILEVLGDRVVGKTITVLGVTFKPDTDDMRESPALTIVPALIGRGATIRVVDPKGRSEGEGLLPSVIWKDDPYEAAEGADMIVLLTEWNVFRGLDLPRLGDAMRTRCFVDLRNVYSTESLRKAGFESVASIGRRGFHHRADHLDVAAE